MDGVGEWATTSLAMGRGRDDRAAAASCTFRTPSGCCIPRSPTTPAFEVNSGEYKVMGLAPYGEPRFARLILDHLIDLKPDGTFLLDQRYFDYCTGLT